MITKPATPSLPERHLFGPGDALADLPQGVDLGRANGPWWTISQAHETWNHIAVMSTQWYSEPQACETDGEITTPALTLIFSADRRMHWCAEHKGDAEPHRGKGVSEYAAGPGWWVPVPDGKVRLICCQRAGDRHPEFDDKIFDDVEAAMRFAWEQGLLSLIVFPELRDRYTH